MAEPEAPKITLPVPVWEAGATYSWYDQEGNNVPWQVVEGEPSVVLPSGDFWMIGVGSLQVLLGWARNSKEGGHFVATPVPKLGHEPYSRSTFDEWSAPEWFQARVTQLLSEPSN